ncbi:MAG TPA: peptidoglycan-binding protein [Polyangiales bacterium]|nr:peptidoglycan-binding protein [Polyangiales bacterium]
MSQVLKSGARGEPVKTLQTDLAALGFAVKVDGVFGPDTVDAIGELQSLFGYDVDQAAGPATQGLITQQKEARFDVRENASIKTAVDAFGNKTALTRVLKSGSHGVDVRYLQRRLNTLGFPLTVDGKFGPAVDKAVRGLQTAFHYDVDGSVGEATNKLINQQISYGWDRAKAPPVA